MTLDEKIDLLLAKSKEFAKKYNVMMTLNSSRLDTLAEEMTIAQLEQDYRTFSKTQANDSSTTESDSGSVSVKIRITPSPYSKKDMRKYEREVKKIRAEKKR